MSASDRADLRISMWDCCYDTAYFTNMYLKQLRSLTQQLKPSMTGNRTVTEKDCGAQRAWGGDALSTLHIVIAFPAWGEEEMEHAWRSLHYSASVSLA